MSEEKPRGKSAWMRFWTGEMFPDPDPPAEEESPQSVEARPRGSDSGQETIQSSQANTRGFSKEALKKADPEKSIGKDTRESLLAFGVGFGLWSFCQLLYWSQIEALQDLPIFLNSREDVRAANEVLDTLTSIGWWETGSLFLMGASVIYFFFQAYRNLGRLGVDNLRYSPHQTIWTWFVPVLNLFRPKQIANDIWRASNYFEPDSPSSWREAPATVSMRVWWGFWLAGSILGTRVALAGLQQRPEFSSSFELGLIYGGFIVFGLHVVAGILLVQFMLGVRDAQDALTLSMDQGIDTGDIDKPSLEEHQPGTASLSKELGGESVGAGGASPPAPPGWYEHPSGSARRSYWDGSAWIDMRDLECAECGAEVTGPFCAQCGAEEAVTLKRD